MAFPTAVNDQITDSIAQANLKVIGDAPAMGMGNLFVATSQALSNAAHNATFAQQQAVTTSQATNVQGLSTLYSIDTASTGIDTEAILGLGTYSKGQRP
jgi:Killing trait